MTKSPAMRIRWWVLVVATAGSSVLLYDGLLAHHFLKTPGGSLTRQRVLDDFHELAYQQFNNDINTDRNKWCGVPTMQNPNDVWITQEIISEVKPDLVVETGTAVGGSAVIWAMVLDQVHPSGRVITIDIVNRVDPATKPPVASRMVDYLIGSSTAPEVVAEVSRRARGKTTMVILDSDHDKNHVLAELKAYAPLVTPGSYLIVQDTNLNGHPVLPDFGPGPMEALNEFLAANPGFASDRSRERLLFSMLPKGYLKRVAD